MVARILRKRTKRPAATDPGGDNPAQDTAAATKKSSSLTKDSGADGSDLMLQKATGAKNPSLQTVVVNQVLNALWLPPDVSEEGRAHRMAAAIALLQGIKPRDELEGTLAAQMVATHSAAMECLRRAMIPNQTFEGRDASLRHAERLLATYARQLEVLDKHRGKGQQQVTVKHINVQSGGQAVVGNVQTNPRSQDRSDRRAPPALTDQSDTGFEIEAQPVPLQESAKRRR